MFARFLPPIGSDPQQTAEQADTRADEADNNSNEEQGITGYRLSNSTDPADSGGKDLCDGG